MVRSERFEWVDSSRGVAILGVVCIHVCCTFLYQTPPRLSPETWWFLSILTCVSKVGVPLFLMLSGTVNLGAPSKSVIDRSYFRRLQRILIPFTFWALVYLIFKAKGGFRWISWMEALGVINGQVHYHLWFVYSIIGLYLITPMVNAFVIAIGESQSLLVGAFLLALTGFEWSIENVFQFYCDANLFKPLPVYAGYYILGYGLRSLKVTPTIRDYSYVTFGACAVVSLGISYYLNRNVESFDNRGFHNLNPVVMAMSISAFVMLKPIDKPAVNQGASWITRTFSLLGRGSFGIYLSHVLLLEVSFQYLYWNNRKVQTSIPVALLAPVAIILITCLSWSVTTAISKVPIMRRLV